MTYTALARKWRPRTFSQLIGQEHIKNTLTNSLNQDRIHHAYLFSGTRGVGKTSIARLFAKALNCEQGISSEPCLTCSHCIAIEKGSFIDLIEVDGASRTRVEDTRELLENVQYVPTSGRYKIYLIDEVHMLSQHSFNALLKTLEEPPEHVKFLLATTEPQKLPITVLSRCLQLNLKHLSVELISEHLQFILQEEKISFDTDAIVLIAKAANGSVRDALSLLDQAIAGNNHLSSTYVKSLLGYSQQDYSLQILKGIAASSVENLLSISKLITAEGGPFNHVINELLHQLHQICIYQVVPSNTKFVSQTIDIEQISKYFSPEDIQLFYQICIKTLEDMHLSPSPVIAFDMMLMRMYMFRPTAPVAPPLSLTKPTQTSITQEQILYVDAFQETSSPIQQIQESPSPISNVEVSKTPDISHNDWSAILPQLNLTGLTLAAAENAEFVSKDNQSVTIRVENGHKSVFTQTVLTRIEDALSRYYGEEIQVCLQFVNEQASTPAAAKRFAHENQHQLAEAALDNDPFLKQLQHEFSAEIIKSSIAPLKDSL
jgi:DNA polymerase-3 subunit gamma/tau